MRIEAEVSIMRKCESCGWHECLPGFQGYHGAEPEEKRCLVIEELRGDYTDEEREQAEEHWNGNRLNCPCHSAPPEK